MTCTYLYKGTKALESGWTKKNWQFNGYLRAKTYGFEIVEKINGNDNIHEQKDIMKSHAFQLIIIGLSEPAKNGQYDRIYYFIDDISDNSAALKWHLKYTVSNRCNVL